MSTLPDTNESRIAAPPASRVTAAELILRAVRDYRSQIALIQDERRVTYAEFGDRITRAAAALAALGVRPGEPVGLIAGNIIEFCEVDFACLIGGFVRCAEMPRAHPRELVGIFNSAAVRVLVVEDSYLDRLLSVRAQLTTVEHIIVIGASSEYSTWDQTLATTATTSNYVTPEATADAWLIYSSGTTGEPKGATLTQGGIVNMARNVLAEVGSMDDTDVLVHSAPLGHLSGCLAFTSLCRGGTQVLLPSFNAEVLLRTVQRHGVTYMVVVPTMLAMLTDTARAKRIDVSSLRTVLYGASTISPTRLSAALETFGNVFVQVYGLTEVPMPLTVLPKQAHRFDPSGPPPRRLRSAGRPIAGVELRLLDDTHADAAPGSPGEIVVRADVRMRGYWGRPDLTSAVLDGEDWFYTGDIGQFDEDGYLYIVDRKKDMIVSGGFNVYPTEVEHVIDAVDGVAEAAVIGIPDEQWGEAVTAVVVRDATATAPISAEAVIGAVRSQLAAYKAPKRVEFLDELPKNARGKVLRRALRDRYSS